MRKTVCSLATIACLAVFAASPAFGVNKETLQMMQQLDTLQQMMQNLVGIVRAEREMCDALDGLAGLKARASHAAVSGHREYNPGWHTALDLRHLLTVSEAITRSALERKESRGGHFREDFPQKDPSYATFNIVSRKGTDGSMEVARVPIPQMPAELKQVIDEEK